MSLLADLSGLLDSAPGYAAARDALDAGEHFSLATSLAVRPLAIAALYRRRPRTVFVVLPTPEAAERFTRQLTAYLPLSRVLSLPDAPRLPWSREPADPHATGERARALWALRTGRQVVVVAPASALLRRLPSTSAPETYEPLVLVRGATLDLDDAVERLSLMGYERVEAAEAPAQFAVRGGTLDVYPSDGHFPVRADLFGDEIDTLRRYVATTGQTVGDIESIEVFPARGIRLSRSVSKDVTHSYRSAFRDLKAKALEDPEIAHDLELIEQGVYFNGVEAYLPRIHKETCTIVDHISKDALVVVGEPRTVFQETVAAGAAFDEAAKEAGYDAADHYIPAAKIDLGERQTLTLLSMMRVGAAADAELPARQPDVAGGETKLVAGLRGLLDSGHRVIFAARDRRQAETMARSLAEDGLPVSHYAGAAHVEPGSANDAPVGLSPKVVYVGVADIPAGFVVPDAHLAVVSVDDAFPRTNTRAASVDPTQLTFEFTPGDYVVHATHGIGLFRELTRREMGGAERDYLLLEYAKGKSGKPDTLWVPVEQLDRVTRYVGPDSSSPKVTRLNTADWSRATGKARKAARELAFDLVDLYARRSTATGFAFSPDTPWQLEMEAAFPFEETPDQVAAIADVKSDMESDEPMDRLICGDVGYGKTEVALRAAFKATQDDKQVMVLCPTTILAQQHYTTFSERFEPYPVRVEVLSRFRSKAEQAAALAGFADGTVDVLVGTHRLLSQDVSPKDLGLIVVDEEQRFGVQHKEHLKNLREQVDVLTMSATPIPRTMQMALSGVRDMSVIDTAPPNRFPVHVHVGAYDEDVIAEALQRELGRGGQVYYVFNRVVNIESAAARVRDLAGDATIGIAHGQMGEHGLERIMESFAAGKTDVLVATTIIESGIDNPHTNTLIIEDSERLGLAQLYQLKGRVGRSHVRAYAYFMFRDTAQLTEQAVERLTAIRELTELGSGIRIAMRDLEIRGAGDLIGAEQHGSMAGVGFDLYAQMLREAVAEARGEAAPAHPDVRIDVPVKAYLPEEYVTDVDDRVRAYRRLAAAATPEAAESIASDLAEKYGPLPEEAGNLVGVSRAKALAAEAGVTTVTFVRGKVVVTPVTLEPEARGRFATQGAIYLEREKKLQVPSAYGEAVMDTVLRVLGDILTDAP